jgi:hypothetical protein
MKKIILLLAVGIALTNQTLIAQVPSYVPTDGLVGYWPFSGNANDESGNGNNGTNSGATLTTDRFGNANSAYDFDGVNNYIEVLSSPSLCVSSEYTISGWVNVTNFDSGGFPYQPAIISKIANGDWNGGYEIRVLNNAANTGSYFATSGIIGGNFININQDNHNINQWYHLVVAYNGNEIKLFINNTIVASTLTTGSLQTSNIPLRFGRRGGAGIYNCWYSGKIDDVGIWNRALTQEEITNLYNANQCITNITVTDTLIINVGQLSFNDPVTYANNITIAPNPASSQININFNNITNLNGGTLKVINSLGQEVATTPITTSGTNSTMQLATWGGTGMYFIQIINPQGQIVDIKKIILQ